VTCGVRPNRWYDDVGGGAVYVRTHGQLMEEIVKLSVQLSRLEAPHSEAKVRGGDVTNRLPEPAREGAASLGCTWHRVMHQTAD
jgi:hypothetical protein